MNPTCVVSRAASVTPQPAFVYIALNYFVSSTNSAMLLFTFLRWFMGKWSTQLHRCSWDSSGNLPFFKKKDLLLLPFLFYYKSFIYLKAFWEGPCQNPFGNTSMLHWQHHRSLCFHWLFPRSSADLSGEIFLPTEVIVFFFQLYRVFPVSLGSTLYHKFPRPVVPSQNYKSVDLWTFSKFLFQNWDHICLFIPLGAFKQGVVRCN